MQTELTQPLAKLAAPAGRVPERWLLIGPDNEWCQQVGSLLKKRADTDPSGFLAWRLKHGLLRVAPVSKIASELEVALAEPKVAGMARSPARIWAALTSAQWYENALKSEALKAPSARSLEVRLLAIDKRLATSVSLVCEEAEQPDTLVRLMCQLNGHPQDVPKHWMALAPMPERSHQQNIEMAKQGALCISAWASDMQGQPNQDESNEDPIWPTTEGGEPILEEADGESEVDSVVADLASGSNVIPIRAQSTPSWDDSKWKQRSVSLAASTAQKRVLESAIQIYKSPPLDPNLFHGASALEAYCTNPASTGSPSSDTQGVIQVEFIAIWAKAPPEGIKFEESPCLIVTLSKHMPIILKNDRYAPEYPRRMRYVWPADRLPKDLPKTNFFEARDWLQKNLKNAQVSLH